MSETAVLSVNITTNKNGSKNLKYLSICDQENSSNCYITTSPQRVCSIRSQLDTVCSVSKTFCSGPNETVKQSDLILHLPPPPLPLPRSVFVVSVGLQPLNHTVQVKLKKKTPKQRLSFFLVFLPSFLPLCINTVVWLPR